LGNFALLEEVLEQGDKTLGDLELDAGDGLPPLLADGDQLAQNWDP
jgi:hypothetical protein